MFLIIGIDWVFEGNTRKKFGEYDIDDRQMYRHYLDNKMYGRRDREREILRRMQQHQTITPSNPETTEPATPEEALEYAEATPRKRLQLKGSYKDKTEQKNEQYPWLVRVLRRLFRARD